MSKLRVISGKAKGHRLKMVPGQAARPITDRVKEALFNIIGPTIAGARFLDLFAGTGSVGIEALSRGAARVVFVDADRKAVQTVRQNLAKTGLGEGAEVIQGDAFGYLARPHPIGFDFIYVAPPQYKEMWRQAVIALDETPGTVNPDGWVIAQIDPREYKALSVRELMEFDQRKYGNTLLVFYERPGD